MSDSNYRMLDVGEVIREGDELCANEGSDPIWVVLTINVWGSKVREGSFIRRLIEPQTECELMAIDFIENTVTLKIIGDKYRLGAGKYRLVKVED